MYKKRLGDEPCRGYTLLRVIEIMLKDFFLIWQSKHHRLQRFAIFQLYIYSKWMTELQRGTENQFLSSLSLCLLFLGGQQTVFTTESEHHPT